MKIVPGEAKEEYDTDVQMAVTRQLILRVNTEHYCPVKAGKSVFEIVET